MSALSRFRAILGLLVVLVAVVLVYLNHFNNGFQFDDRHTVSENLFIRDLKFAPKYFTDASTFSTLPPNQSYRPVVTLSLAVDYWLGGGLIPFYFHIITFCLFLLQLVLMFYLIRRLFNLADDSDENRNLWLALFATALYGLHPVCAETVNYIIQRADIQSTLGVVASMYLYVCVPTSRRFCVYLIPVVIGMFAKPPAVMFVPILFVYDLLFEQRWETRLFFFRIGLSKIFRAGVKCLPAAIISLAFYVLQKVLSPTFSTGSSETYCYLITQPLVSFHYFKSFFFPTDLSIDAQFELFESPLQTSALAGFAFLILLTFAIYRSANNKVNYPIAFGLSWFLFALLPTSLIPLAEAANDHRMFFPFVGLSIAVFWAIGQLRYVHANRYYRIIGIAVCVLWLLIFGAWTRERNHLWSSSEGLWKEAAEKGPRNGRAQMNYGLSLMSRGDYSGALTLFRKALLFTPNYHSLEINLGVANAAMGSSEEAEKHFKRAVSLRPELAEPYLFYSSNLLKNKRIDDASALLTQAINRNVRHAQIYRILLPILLNKGDFGQAATIRALMRDIGIKDHEVAFFDRFLESRVKLAVPHGPSDDSAGSWLNLSLSLYEAQAYEQCIAAANEALARDPGSAGALNNISAAYNQLGKWEESIKAARRALELKSDFALAAGNLKYAESQLASRMKGESLRQ